MSSTTTPISLRNPSRTIHAGVILLGGITEVLDIAPIDFLGGISKDFTSLFPDEVIPASMKDQAIDVQIHYVNETGQPAKLTSGMTIKVTDTFTSCPPLDVLLVGATIGTYTPTPTELSFLRTQHASPALQAFLTICGGMIPALQAGLLSGRCATAPRPMLSQLRRDAPDVNWTERRWAQDGKIWTSGTLLNGLDMIRAWASSVWGTEGVEDGEGEGKDRKEGNLVDFTLSVCGWPDRDVEYRDENEATKKWTAAKIPV